MDIKKILILLIISAFNMVNAFNFNFYINTTDDNFITSKEVTKVELKDQSHTNSKISQEMHRLLLKDSFSKEEIQKLETFFVGKEKDVKKYNKNGKIIESLEYDKRGNIDDRTVYKYDTTGNLIKKYEYDEEELEDVYVYSYTAEGKIKEYRKLNHGKSIQKRILYKYNNSGHLFLTEEYGSDLSLKRKTMYSNHDEFGNWTIKVIREIGTEQESTVYTRKLEYK